MRLGTDSRDWGGYFTGSTLERVFFKFNGKAALLSDSDFLLLSFIVVGESSFPHFFSFFLDFSWRIVFHWT